MKTASPNKLQELVFGIYWVIRQYWWVPVVLVVAYSYVDVGGVLYALRMTKQ